MKGAQQSKEEVASALECSGFPDAKALFDGVNDLIVRHPRLVEAKHYADLMIKLGPYADEAPCSEICGPSGIGKSTLWDWLRDESAAGEEWCEYRLPKRPPGRVKRKPYLTIKLQQQPTIGKICDEFLQELGDPFWWQGNATEKTVRVDILLHAAQVQAVFIDEFQYVVDRSGVVVSEAIVDWLRDRHMPASRTRMNLPDARSIAICLLGLGRLSAIFSDDPQRLRRWDAGWRIEPYSNQGSDLEDFASIIASFLNAVQLPIDPSIDPTDPAIVDRFHYASWGVPGYIKKLFSGTMFLAGLHPRRHAQFDMGLLRAAFTHVTRLEEFEVPTVGVNRGRLANRSIMQNPFDDNFDTSLPSPILMDDRQALPSPESRRKMASTRRLRGAAIDALFTK